MGAKVAGRMGGWMMGRWMERSGWGIDRWRIGMG